MLGEEIESGEKHADNLSPVIFGYMIDFGMGILSISIMCLSIIVFSTLLPFYYNKDK